MIRTQSILEKLTIAYLVVMIDMNLGPDATCNRIHISLINRVLMSTTISIVIEAIQSKLSNRRLMPLQELKVK